MSRAFLAGAAFLSLATVPGPAPADTFFETVYLPTSSVVTLPTSSVLATSYVIPTSYSTTYIPTSSVIASGEYLVPTSTVVRRSVLRPRRYVERTSYSLLPTTFVSPTSYLLPTSYVVPTSLLSTSYVVPTSFVSSSFLTPTSYVVDNGVITTSASSYPCETTSSPAPTRSSASRSQGGNNGGGSPIISEPTNGGSSNERRPSATLNSTPGGEDGIPSPVVPPVPASANPSGPAQTPTPPAPLAEPDPLKVNVPEPGKSGAQAQQGETTYRGSRRPAYDVRNILRGRVISAETRQPEEGVSVIISSQTKNFSDRTAMTDAFGEFRVSLPDGDWTVKVKMPSGSIYPVGRDFVTANSGRVTDSSGRNVAEFLITR
jgi:hypothetical protein